MLKFQFAIQTREGHKINSLIIAGRDQEHAETKLRQMYRYCDILRCNIDHREEKRLPHSTSLEDILTMIAR